MTERSQTPRPLPHVNSYALVLALVWTTTIFSVFGWHIWEVYENTIESARLQASNSFAKDLVYRRWAASHGGVYVPMSQQTPPNPYLAHLQNRDVTSTSGLELTLVNPAYMTRQVHELGHEQYGHQGHITSLKPLRPENAPDAWEAEALRAIERGAAKVTEIAKIGDRDYMRLMQPLITEASCLKCHAIQGYEQGDIRGGISVSVPMAPLQTIMTGHMVSMGLGYGLIWLLGLGGIGLGASRIGRRIRERKQAEDALLLTQASVDNSTDAVYWMGPDAKFIYVNRAAVEALGYSEQELLSMTVHDVDPGFSTEVWPAHWAELKEKRSFLLHTLHRRKDESTFPVELTVNFLQFGGREINSAMAKDITEKTKLEEQLRQAQKLESVGRLAGGVAHDFNNMMGVVLGHAEMALEQVDSSQPLHEGLVEIRAAAERAANLTRQLLALARRQTISLRVLELNETVGQMIKMLQRLIGEDVDLAWLPGEDLWPVEVDPAQIDQILTDLCSNARDAIEGGGKITIETENIKLDKDHGIDHPGILPGEYVLLNVSDSGCGMDEQTLAKIYEPFFTTKVVGKGTGLGLSTVYGIVKQNKGFLHATSEPGQGTTFKIYLPRHVAEAAQMPKESPAELGNQGTETILVVEDEPAILKMLTNMLEGHGYTVLATSKPSEAIRLAKESTAQVRLLMTDVVMPEMSGRDVADSLLTHFPKLKCLFMSGHTADLIAHHGVLDEGVNFIEKPFSLIDLTSKVRELLDGE